MPTSDLRDTRSCWTRSHASSSRTSGSARSFRTARRSAAGLPLTSRSIANSPSIRRTASAAIGAFETAAISNSFLLACAQQAASRIGPGARLGS